MSYKTSPGYLSLIDDSTLYQLSNVFLIRQKETYSFVYLLFSLVKKISFARQFSNKTGSDDLKKCWIVIS